MAGTNRVVISGNLTRDPELRTAGETKVCSLRIANNTRVRDHGEWTDKANYVTVTVFGRQAESCDRYLKKGRPVMIDGRLDYQEWEAKDGSGKRSELRIIADNVQFLDGGGSSSERDSGVSEPRGEAPPVSPPPAEDDIPF
jgi:single-strand DNA-binding protein